MDEVERSRNMLQQLKCCVYLMRSVFALPETSGRLYVSGLDVYVLFLLVSGCRCLWLYCACFSVSVALADRGCVGAVFPCLWLWLLHYGFVDKALQSCSNEYR